MIIPIDNYYHHRVDMVRKEDGNFDFEHIGSIQAPLLAERVRKLLLGEEIPIRHFDFITGRGSDTEEHLSLNQNGFIIVEGIHGINPELLDLLLTPAIRVYVSPMTPICYDDQHPISPRDICLIRRVVRDNRERGYSPRSTIGVWADVCDGEERNICPYLPTVEYFFNSSFVYELPLISQASLSIFEEASQPESGEEADSIKAKFINAEVARLRLMLNLCGKLKAVSLRRNSGISEFVGEEFASTN